MKSKKSEKLTTLTKKDFLSILGCIAVDCNGPYIFWLSDSYTIFEEKNTDSYVTLNHLSDGIVFFIFHKINFTENLKNIFGGNRDDCLYIRQVVETLVKCIPNLEVVVKFEECKFEDEE
jgi:hypothetical protein